jgi:predicted dehydrogenase
VQAYTATVGHERVEVEDNAVAAVHFKNGAFGVIQGSTSVYPGYPKRIEISGTKGSAVLEESVLKAWDFAETQPEDSNIRATYGSTAPIGGGASDPMAINFAGHQREFEDLIRAVESGEKPALDGREARKAVAIILAIYRSAEMRREILVTGQ